ncbi:MAG TPA: SHOCT domain-containing protein [bacterium]|nr:SHOCT domain-containing protein [bacterium]
MRNRWVPALVALAGIAMLTGLLGGAPGGLATPALAQQGTHLSAQGAPAPSTPNAPGGPGYGPGNPGYGPRFGPGFGPGGVPFGRGRRGFGARAGIAAGLFAIGALLRFVFLIALLVIAWKVITLRSLWGRPDAAVQVVRERFARGEISEEEYRKRLAALS